MGICVCNQREQQEEIETNPMKKNREETDRNLVDENEQTKEKYYYVKSAQKKKFDLTDVEDNHRNIINNNTNNIIIVEVKRESNQIEVAHEIPLDSKNQNPQKVNNLIETEEQVEQQVEVQEENDFDYHGYSKGIFNMFNNIRLTSEKHVNKFSNAGNNIF
jgi:hypothetical protein